MKADDLFSSITASLIADIEAGAGTWEMPWKRLARLPKSLSTGEPYRGINALILGLTAEDRRTGRRTSGPPSNGGRSTTPLS